MFNRFDFQVVLVTFRRHNGLDSNVNFIFAVTRSSTIHWASRSSHKRKTRPPESVSSDAHSEGTTRSPVAAPDLPRGEYETGRVTCEECGEAVSFRDESTGGFTVSLWEAHRMEWCVLAMHFMNRPSLRLSFPAMQVPHNRFHPRSARSSLYGSRWQSLTRSADALSVRRRSVSSIYVRIHTSRNLRPTAFYANVVTSGFDYARTQHTAPFLGMPIAGAVCQKECKPLSLLSCKLL